MTTLRIPLATYRLQFNARFRLEQALALVDYLDRLGISDIYSSPLLQAQKGSLHGYDCTDPTHLNSEIGSEQDLDSLAGRLHERHMGLLLDIVPNHMAAGSENPWWMDVLEDGPASAYASFFDIDWHPPRKMLHNKVLLPILGSPYAEALESQAFKLTYEQSGFYIQLYGDIKLPVAPKSYLLILHYRLGELETALGAEHPVIRELGGLFAAANHLPDRVALASELAGERRLQREALKERLWNLSQSSPELKNFVDENVRLFNGHKKKPDSFVMLDRLLGEQAYILSYWLSSNAEINYRRFFTINNLVGMRVEDPLVFEATHAVILRLIERGLVTGLRIDHIDGLRDPHAYLRRLQERAGGTAVNGSHPPFYVVVEKILAHAERLPEEWPTCGSTGYDSLNALNGLFADAAGRRKLQKVYEDFLGWPTSFENLVYQKKKEVMQSLLAVEMRSLGHYLALLAEQDRYARDLRRPDLTSALTETTACMPVYRTYTRSFSIAADEGRYIEEAIEKARKRNPSIESHCFDFVSDVLLLHESGHVQPDQREARLAFVMRWQQFTGPIMAKGMEDSALYVCNSLTSLNEVGGDPQSNGVSPGEFHAFCRDQQKHGHSLNATSTHDTKRAEDVRARINVLSEIPERWEQCLARWADWNAPKKKVINERTVPCSNEEILLYQTMLGAWPLNPKEVPEFIARLEAFMVKAVREGRVHSNWVRPNLRFEQALTRFVRAVAKPGAGNAFLADFLALQSEIAFYGAINSLSQLLIKMTMPGIPDFYQGSELWDFRMVDPDNRGAVDFAERARLLESVWKQDATDGRLKFIHEVMEHWEDGRIKLFLTSIILNFRRTHGALFLQGDHEPVAASGPKRENVFSFARHFENEWAIAVAPRMVTRLGPAGKPPIGDDVWSGTSLLLPQGAPTEWTHVLTGEKLIGRVSGKKAALPIAHILKELPVALLAGAGEGL